MSPIFIWEDLQKVGDEADIEIKTKNNSGSNETLQNVLVPLV